MSDDTVPRSESRGTVEDGDLLLTHAVWRNSMGSCQPETGVRHNGTWLGLVEHGWHDFDAATPIILHALRKRWSLYRISTFMERLAERRRQKPRFL